MDFNAARARLIKKIGSEIKDKRVLEIMSRIPRELFVPDGVRHQAYEDKPLPIGYEQTISQPFIVALMTAGLDIQGTEKVLELGTGCGYQTAILAELAAEVISIERVPELAETARNVLDNLGYRNVHIYIVGENLGRQQDGPYDAIMVTAGAPSVPDDLVAQLKNGGRMIIPVGTKYLQELCKVTKQVDKTTVENLGGCRFVSLIGKDAWGK